MFSGWTVSGIAVVNTVKLLDAVLARVQGTVFSDFGSNTVLPTLCWRSFVGTQSAAQRLVVLWEQETCGIV